MIRAGKPIKNDESNKQAAIVWYVVIGLNPYF
jgi:hypothetical protein